VSPPNPQDQIRFLLNLQRLLAEGQFVATYKFALLMALADISVELGDDSGSALKVDTSKIAEKFIAYYWRQSLPYTGAGVSHVLQQNTGRPATVLSLLVKARAKFESLNALMANRGTWNTLVTEVGGVVRKMPLWKLQTVGRDRLDFLYENAERGTKIELRPGVAYSFRRFYDLIAELVRGAWLRYVRQQNLGVIGEAMDLGEFLFGGERNSLVAARPVLLEVQQGRCFYCGKGITGTSEVDHFIPWSRYPVDLGHNFVLADSRCNNQKRDRLPAFEHLSSWSTRNTNHGSELTRQLSERNIHCDPEATSRIVRWAYTQTALSSGLTWLRANEMVPLDQRWQEVLSSST
jgi:hypothetical protein